MAKICVQVCHARPEAQFLRDLHLPEGATVQQAIESSGVLQVLPGLDMANLRVGVFGKLKTLDTVLRDRDRVEIYRSLVADPKESRRKRAIRRGGQDDR